MGFALIRINRKIDKLFEFIRNCFIKEKVIIRDALYPTFYATYPFDAQTIKLIEDNYRSHILNARQKLDFSDKEFDRIIRPIIHHVIRYFMALPASERHHHTDMSASLFYHSLQTANIALAKYNSTTVIPDHIKIEHKNEYKHAAGVAVFLAALFHDAGKLFSDMSVYPSDEKGQLVSTEPWDPICESLFDYCQKNGVTHYRVKFDVNRKHNAHNAFTTRFVSTMPDFPDDYKCSSQILVILDGILFGTKEPHTATLTRLVKEADSQSLTMDFQRYSRPIQSDNLSVLTLDSIKSYIEYYPDLSPTDSRSVLIRTNLGVHIPYPSGMEELINFARGNHSKISSKVRDLIPNADRLLKILNESGYLQHHYFQTVSRSPQVVRTIKFEHNGQYHSLNVITLRPSEVIALIPTRHVLNATYDDEISKDFLQVAKQSMLNSQSPVPQSQAANSNSKTSEQPTQPPVNYQRDDRPDEPDPLPLIKNTISVDGIEQAIEGADEIDIVLTQPKKEVQPEALSSNTPKQPEPKPSSTNKSADKTPPKEYVELMRHIEPKHIESLKPDWKESDTIKELDRALYEIHLYRNSHDKQKLFIQELCVAFSKGLIQYIDGSPHSEFSQGQIFISFPLINYFCENTPSGDSYNINHINTYVDEDSSVFNTKVKMPSNGKVCVSIAAEISEVLLGSEYQILLEKDE